MKTIIMILSTIVATANAECVRSTETATTKVQTPKQLTEGNIIVVDNSGNRYDFDSNEYMVVRRIKVSRVDKVVCEAPAKQSQKNSVALGARQDYVGLNTKTKGNTATVEKEEDLVLDLNYIRHNLFNTDTLVGGSLDTNGTPRIIIGVGF